MQAIDNSSADPLHYAELLASERHKWLDFHLSSFEIYARLRNRTYAMTLVVSGAVMSIALAGQISNLAGAAMLLVLGIFSNFAVNYAGSVVRFNWATIKALSDQAGQQFPEMEILKDIRDRSLPQDRSNQAQRIFIFSAGLIAWVPAGILYVLK